jgi:hypothetical protein
MQSRNKQAQRKYKQFENFTVINKLPYEKSRALHEIWQICKKPKTNDDSPKRDRNTRPWYYKRSKYAIPEVIAQELLRLLIPACDYPKTRIIENKKGQLGIISKEIPNHSNYVVSKDTFSEEILGELQIIIIFLNELDFRFKNLIKDLLRNIVKVDGDWCFGKMRKTKDEEFVGKHDITAEDIQTLPYPKNYFPYHWLDFIQAGKYTQEPKLCYANLTNNPRFRHGVNRGIIKCLAFNDIFFKLFVMSYVEEQHANIAATFIQELLARQQQLAAAALQNQDFIHYLSSDQSAKDFVKHLEYVTSFITQDKHYLLEDAPPQANLNDLAKNYEALRKSASNHPFWHKIKPESQQAPRPASPTETKSSSSSP